LKVTFSSILSLLSPFRSESNATMACPESERARVRERESESERERFRF